MIPLLRRGVRPFVVVLAGYLALLSGPGAATAAAPTYALIQGSGSSWAANAVNQWVAEVDAKDLKVVYTANGAAQGRKDYANKSTDFGVTDSPYRGKDPSTGAVDSSLGRSFAYLPVVAGGTAFPYNLQVGGKQVRTLRLSGETLAKIFTIKITNWNDPAITSDNNGKALPSIPIIPVVRADGAGVTNQFSTWMTSQYATLWRDCNGGKAVPTDYFPLNCGAARGQQRAQTGSDGVMNFLKSKGSVGAIAMEEYSYPLAADYPVAKLLNKAGYYTLPTQYNVAVALTQAEINDDPKDPNYLTQKLDRVYVNPDKRTYPLSSYVYAIIPTASNDSRMTTAKRQALVDFLKHSICVGQSAIGPIGYSPLPVNLVQASFTQVNKLKLADPNVQFDASIIKNVKDCHNPTFVPGKPSENYLAKIAPMPAACDRPGQGPCAEGVGSFNLNPGDKGTGAKPSGQPSAGAPAPGAAGAPPSVDTDGDGVPDAAAPAGAPVADDGAGAGTTSTDVSVVAATLDPDSGSGPPTVLAALVIGLFGGVLVIPPVVAQVVGRSKGRR
ncbi:phosphate ABC transporter substrate-binding protein PstS [Nocardioides ginsengisoli]|uniref:Substrate-binding domain-containing protein n=1 Tax=Nocardioides ginsengisoli TaxID=363868 RepID=A0ABW3VZQ6_9ACTN